jgi:ribosomal protein L16 Arg81 hydroxylase
VLNLNFDHNLLLEDKPAFFKNAFPDVLNFVTWDDIEDCVNRPGLFGAELINYNNDKLSASTGYDFVKEKQFLFDKINRGYGLVLINYGFYNQKARDLLTFFENNFDVNASIHVYCGLSSSKSFKIHSDEPSNFILQVEGRCHWRVYENRMSHLIDWPAQKMDIDESQLRVAIDVTMEPGDVLYIPQRQYHCAFPEDRRISMSIPCFSRKKNDKPSVDRNFYRINREI